MCGRFTLDIDERFYPRFRLNSSNILYFPAKYNIAPGQFSVTITNPDNNNQVFQAELMRWGLIPFWAKDQKTGYKMINAKAETLFEKPAYRKAASKNRCLVPASGFYEWKPESDSKKQPYYIHSLTSDYLSFAGIFDEWLDPVSGKMLKTFSIVTTSANRFMKGIHERMPLILTPELEELWMDNNAESAALEHLLSQQPEAGLEAYPVSTEVNSPKNEGRKLILPL